MVGKFGDKAFEFEWYDFYFCTTATTGDDKLFLEVLVLLLANNIIFNELTRLP